MRGGLILGRTIGPGAAGGGQHPQGLGGHAVVIRQNFPAAVVGHGQGLSALPIVGAAGQHLIRRALGILHHAPGGPVNGGHHLAAGVEGGLADAGALLLQLGLGQLIFCGEGYQGRLRRLSLDGAVGVQDGVTAQGHGGGQQGGVPGVVHHGHLVLGQGAGFVGTDHLGTAQGLHRRQAADHGIAAAHAGDADAEHHRYHRGQALGNGGHRQGHGHHEGLQDAGQGEVPGHDQVKHEDEHADAQHQPGQGLAQLGQLLLQRRLLLLRPGQDAGDLAHLRVHAGGGDHHAAPAVGHGGAHIGHVAAVAQGHLAGKGLRGLGGGDAFAGEGGLLNLQGGTGQQPSVGGDRVPGLQQDDIAGYQAAALQLRDGAAPQDLAGGGGHGLQSLDGGLGLALLDHAQNGVQQHHRQDDQHLGEGLMGQVVGDGGHGGGGHEDQQHGVLQLLQKTLKQGGLGGLPQTVGAVLPQAGLRLPAGKAGLGGVQVLQDLPGGLVVLLVHTLHSL